MGFDLTNQNISDTFQNLLQRTGSNNQLYDLHGNAVTNLMINGDLERLKICFGNLIQNAINYSEKGGISILIKNISNHINIKIIDNGIGIPIEYQNRIFERFFRVDDSRSRSSGGSGLGLAIVKHILEAHDSSISIDSTPEQGTIIEFTLNKIDV